MDLSYSPCSKYAAAEAKTDHACTLDTASANKTNTASPARFVRNEISLGHVSQALVKCVMAVAKSRFLYASAPNFFSASASFLTAASSSFSASAWSAILTSSGSCTLEEDA